MNNLEIINNLEILKNDLISNNINFKKKNYNNIFEESYKFLTLIYKENIFENINYLDFIY